MGKITLLGVASFTLLVLVFNVDARRRNGICPWMSYKNGTCLKNNFLCFNGKCIGRGLYCDGKNDCGDNSDERYCNDYNCPERYELRKCSSYNKCIPKHWFCDGIRDCPDGRDEYPCDGTGDKQTIAVTKALRWLYGQRKEDAGEVWGNMVDKSAVALYSTDLDFRTKSNGTRREIAYEVSIRLLSRLSKKKLQDIPATDLASFVNAFLASCLDPRKFHGLNIVEELRNRVNSQNYTNPYVLLSLCNAGDTITESDKMKLIDAFWSKRRTFWTDTQAVAVLALACASKQPGNEVDLETLHELTLELKQRQYKNGSVESLQTTALVMQALFAAEPEDDPDNFDEVKALEQILSSQKPDGSFGSLMNTYFVLPVLSCQSLVNISSDHCQSIRKDDEISALENLVNERGPKTRVQYSLWIGNDKDLERNLVLRVPANMSFYGIMEIAAQIDNRYSFEYAVKNRKPYVNAISGLQDNPEKGKFWFLYKVEGGKPSPAQESPGEVRPKNNDHFAMWYRSGSWID